MPRPKAIRAPTTTSLSNSLRLPSTTPSLVKIFGKLSRQALLDLVFQWLDHRSVQEFSPYLDQDNADPRDDDETSPYPPAKTVDEVRDVYYDLQDRKGAKREVIDRILEGDWRHGITLRQLAMVDICYMDDHPSSLRWTAMELVPISIQDNKIREDSTDNSSAIPRVHTATFLNNLQQQISPLIKAHYHLVRSNSLPLTFLRILVTDSPYQNLRDLPETLTDSSRVIYVVFPDSCPFIYTSISSTTPKASATTTSAVATDSRSLQRLVRESIPAALSRAQEKYTLKPTSLTAKSLQALLALRGPGRSNAANGAFSIFADAAVEGSPLDPRPADTVSSEEYMSRQPDRAPGDEGDAKNDGSLPTSMKKPNDGDTNSPASKRRKVAVNSRFGTSGSLSSAPLDRLDIRMLDRPDQDEEDGSIELNQPWVSLTFSGADVVSGIRKLSELGVVDPLRMPSWMTGEEGVSVAVVHRGKRVVKDGG